VDNNPGKEHFDCLHKAIAARTVCEVVYRDVEYRFPERDPAPVTYSFIPVRVTCEDDTLGIEGWKIKNNNRLKVDYPLTFELQRIVSCRDTGQFFADYPPLPEHEGAFGLVGFQAFPARVVFSTEYASYIRERIWSEGQEITDLPDGRIELRFMAADEDQLIGWVLSFGNGAELKEPLDVRRNLFEELKDLRDVYSKGETDENNDLQQENKP
jgi:predicted DNA-binding transcriptional regulator YafY